MELFLFSTFIGSIVLSGMFLWVGACMVGNKDALLKALPAIDKQAKSVRSGWGKIVAITIFSLKLYSTLYLLSGLFINNFLLTAFCALLCLMSIALVLYIFLRLNSSLKGVLVNLGGAIITLALLGLLGCILFLTLKSLFLYCGPGAWGEIVSNLELLQTPLLISTLFSVAVGGGVKLSLILYIRILLELKKYQPKLFYSFLFIFRFLKAFPTIFYSFFAYFIVNSLKDGQALELINSGSIFYILAIVFTLRWTIYYLGTSTINNEFIKITFLKLVNQVFFDFNFLYIFSFLLGNHNKVEIFGAPVALIDGFVKFENSYSCPSALSGYIYTSGVVFLLIHSCFYILLKRKI